MDQHTQPSPVFTLQTFPMNCAYCHRPNCYLCPNFLIYLRFRLGELAKNELALWWRKNGHDAELICEIETIFAQPKEELSSSEARMVWLPWTHLNLCFFCNGAMGEGYRKGNGRL